MRNSGIVACVKLCDYKVFKYTNRGHFFTVLWYINSPSLFDVLGSQSKFNGISRVFTDVCAGVLASGSRDRRLTARTTMTTSVIGRRPWNQVSCSLVPGMLSSPPALTTGQIRWLTHRLQPEQGPFNNYRTYNWAIFNNHLIKCVSYPTVYIKKIITLNPTNMLSIGGLVLKPKYPGGTCRIRRWSCAVECGRSGLRTLNTIWFYMDLFDFLSL